MTNKTREESIEDYTDHLLHEIEKAIKKSGGDFESFLVHMHFTDTVKIIDDAVKEAFEGVDEIVYKGCF